MLAISRLTVEGLEENVVTDEMHPHISLKVKANSRDVELKNIHIEVRDSSGTGMWKFDTVRQIEIPYEGAELKPESTYLVKVSVLDNRGESAEKEMSFSTGLLNSRW